MCRSASVLGKQGNSTGADSEGPKKQEGVDESTIAIIISSVIGAILLLTVIGGFIWWKRRQDRKSNGVPPGPHMTSRSNVTTKDISLPYASLDQGGASSLSFRTKGEGNEFRGGGSSSQPTLDPSPFADRHSIPLSDQGLSSASRSKSFIHEPEHYDPWEEDGVDYTYPKNSPGAGSLQEAAEATLALVTLSHRPSVRAITPETIVAPSYPMEYNNREQHKMENPFASPTRSLSRTKNAPPPNQSAQHEGKERPVSVAISVASTVESVPEVSLARRTTLSPHPSPVASQSGVSLGRPSVLLWKRGETIPLATRSKSEGDQVDDQISDSSTAPSTIHSPSGPIMGKRHSMTRSGKLHPTSTDLRGMDMVGAMNKLPSITEVTGGSTDPSLCLNNPSLLQPSTMEAPLQRSLNLSDLSMEASIMSSGSSSFGFSNGSLNHSFEKPGSSLEPSSLTDMSVSSEFPPSLQSMGSGQSLDVSSLAPEQQGFFKSTELQQHRKQQQAQRHPQPWQNLHHPDARLAQISKLVSEVKDLETILFSNCPSQRAYRQEVENALRVLEDLKSKARARVSKEGGGGGRVTRRRRQSVDSGAIGPSSITLHPVPLVRGGGHFLPSGPKDPPMTLTSIRQSSSFDNAS
ncbi:hypothetical protein BJ684DRAFT_18384 [Piptocephalis cylindrospora]|uniref:Uncharacterized protein n=1 Tax=Piptocephalis cylindrospora TaxID=1907219 RepID=A0A4V1IYP6_9FUNG|nr:hypothetical protein BJ684DRAFT_18384 [Piptocephalis cylindrospora]|eukprot:RKP15289.1 hypothetical protein BJ684DRAFT_18384 [Piptocephalis cylindrospora]